MRRWPFVVGALLAASALTLPGDPPPVELGRVAWLRDFAKAEAEARSTGRPLMVLFDEVPG